MVIMIIGMITDGMPLLPDGIDQLGAALGLLSQHKKSRLHLLLAQGFQHCRRHITGAVIKSEVDHLLFLLLFILLHRGHNGCYRLPGYSGYFGCTIPLCAAAYRDAGRRHSLGRNRRYVNRINSRHGQILRRGSRKIILREYSHYT
ncbi:hypothetical protein D3C81_1554730 [compost metagenome]